MRILATAAFSFSAAVFAAVLVPAAGWQLWAAAVFAFIGGILLLLRRWKHRKRDLLVTFSLCAGFLFFCGYRAVYVAPIEAQCGQEQSFTAVVCERPVGTDYGAKVTVRLRGAHHGKAVYYGDAALLELVPGNELSGRAHWKQVDYSTLSARGIRVLLYDRGELAVGQGNTDSIRWWPQRMAAAFQGKIAQLWEDGSVRAFVSAELIGDRSRLVREDYTALQETGLAHLFAVSGLHCAFLASLVRFFIPANRRRTGCIVTIGVLLFYMCMTGLTPSVVRACVMQIFLLTAPLFFRAGDGLTSLGTALLVILLANPYAAASISLQLSFTATLGLVILFPRIFARGRKRYRKAARPIRTAAGLVNAALSASVSVMVFTVPLTAYYFNIFSLVAPLTGLLTVWAAGWSFMSGFAAVLLGFLWTPLGRIAGVVTTVLIRYILAVAHLLARLPYHAVYFNTDSLRYWLIYVYGLFGICLLFRREKPRKYVLASFLAALSLLLTLWCNTLSYRGSPLSVTVLDVGQGQSVLLYGGHEAMVIDCGSTASYVYAGDVAAEELTAMGYTRLKAVAVTHYHADHTNGLCELLSRIPVDVLYLPDIEDTYGVRQQLCETAVRYGSDIVWVTQPTEVSLGEAAVQLFPPLDGEDLNEQCITAVGTAGDFDVLVTGDMPAAMEVLLTEKYTLPDTEVLVVSHHGSKHSSDTAFLEAVTPDVAVISVGKNSYGHPAQETLWRLSNAGAEIYRTDEAGHITVRSNGGRE